MNAWVLAKDLSAIAEAAETPELRQLYLLIKENYTYPVDSMVISPDLKVLGQMEVQRSFVESYRDFLINATMKTNDPG